MEPKISHDISITKQHDKTRKNYSQATRNVIKKLNNCDLKNLDFREADFLACQNRNVGIEVLDDENDNIIEGDDSGIKERTVLKKDRLMTKLRGYLGEEDHLQLKQLQTKIYGHLNIEKLTAQSKQTVTEKH